jgi:DNA mismatch endonuclease (patch repair protein)
VAKSRRNEYVTDPTTSRRMSAVRPIDTTPEKRLRRILTDMGTRYRLHGYRLPGRPDVVFPGRKKVIFVHGCYWHRHHGCSRATTPVRNRSLWNQKFEATVLRDRRNAELLEGSGWHSLVIWECQLDALDDVRARLAAFLAEE